MACWHPGVWRTWSCSTPIRQEDIANTTRIKAVWHRGKQVYASAPSDPVRGCLGKRERAAGILASSCLRLMSSSDSKGR